MNLGPIEIFKAGTWMTMGGEQVTYSEAALRDIAAIYDEGSAPAPIVIGHPATDAPAYGWVDRLFVEGGKLKATIRDAVGAFADQVRAGRYRKVSVALFKPDAANNPKPGSWYLKHVGFLGAAAPAVAGLSPVRFAGAEPGDTVEFTLGDTAEPCRPRMPAGFSADPARLALYDRASEIQRDQGVSFAEAAELAERAS